MKELPCQPTSTCLNSLSPARLLQHHHGHQSTRPRYEVCEISGLAAVLGNGNFQVEDIIRFAAEEGDFELIHSVFKDAVWDRPCTPFFRVAEEMRIGV